MIAGQKQSTIMSIAALAIAVLAARGSPQLVAGGDRGRRRGAIQTQLNYTRDHEREADRIGFQILDHSGFDVRAMPLFFERLQRATRHLREQRALLPAHPPAHHRAHRRHAEPHRKAHPYRQVADSIDFQIAAREDTRDLGHAARKRSRSSGKASASRNSSNEAAARYGLATALMRAQQYPEAKDELRKLRAMLPSNPIVETLAGRVLVASGDLPGALIFYRSALRAHPALSGPRARLRSDAAAGPAGGRGAQVF